MTSRQSPQQDAVNKTAAEQPAALPAPKRMTAGQQAALTIKVLAAAAAMIGLFWFLDQGA
jgi:hypothetical protein